MNVNGLMARARSRRFVLGLLVLIACGAACYGYTTGVTVRQSTASAIVVPPPTVSPHGDTGGANALENLTPRISQLVEVIGRSLSSEPAKRAVAAAAPGTTYEASSIANLGPETQLPSTQLTITVLCSATTDCQAGAKAALDYARDTLTKLQVNTPVAPENWASLMVLQQPSTPVVVATGALKSAGSLAVAILLGGWILTLICTAILSRRRAPQSDGTALSSRPLPDLARASPEDRAQSTGVIRVVAFACVLLLGTRQAYAVYAMKGLSPAVLILVLVGVLGIYALVAGLRFSFGVRGLTIAMLLYVLATIMSWHTVMTRLHPANVFIQAGQGLSTLLVGLVSVVGFVYLFAAYRDRVAYIFETILKALLLGATITAVLALIQFVTGVDLAAMIRIPGIMKITNAGPLQLERGGVVRAVGAAGHALELSAVLTTIAPIGFALMYKAKAVGERTWPWAVMTGAIVAGAVVTVSRSAFIGLAAAVLVMSWRWPVRRLLGMIALACAAVSIAAVSGLSVVDAIIKTFLGSSNDPSLQSRARGINYVTAHWTDHFWLGQGSFTYPLGLQQPVLDNEYLSRLMEGGLLGLLSLVALLLAAIGYAAKARSRSTAPAVTELINGVLGALVALTVVSSILDVSGFGQISMIRWILVILAGAAWWLTADRPDRADDAHSPTPANEVLTHARSA